MQVFSIDHEFAEAQVDLLTGVKKSKRNKNLHNYHDKAFCFSVVPRFAHHKDSIETVSVTS